jgi:phosphate/phosphite/phosphonate ABC transporter binding protein
MGLTKVRFGLTITDGGADKERAPVPFVAELSKRAGIELEAVTSPSYEALATAMNKGELELAWLPPVVFLRTDPKKTKPLVAIRRGSDGSYHSALIVREDAPFKEAKDLAGSRAAWVDPWSAAGFILPRLALLSKGIDPRTLFRAESFQWSHKAAVVAVVDGAADVAGTYAHVNADGKIVTGGWTSVKDAKVRVLEQVGRVPPDLMCASASLDDALVTKVRDALLAATADDELGKAAQTLFQSSSFAALGEGDYDGLRKELDIAEQKKLFAS